MKMKKRRRAPLFRVGARVLRACWARLFAQFGGAVDVLHIVQRLEGIEQFLHAYGLIAGEFDDVLRPHRHFAELGAEAGCFQRLLHRSEFPRSGDDGLKMQKLLDALESLDDVQEIYTTAVIED